MAENTMESRVMKLEKSEAEIRVYMSAIREDIQEIRLSIENLSNQLLREKEFSQAQANVAWQTMVTELIKLVSLSVLILGAIVGVVKWAGQ